MAAAACLTVLTAACSGSGAADPASSASGAASGPATGPAAPASSGGRGAVYYLALGDSLSQGVQPVSSGQQHVTSQGYVDDVYAHYAAESKFKGSLTLVKLGCSGATTTSMLNGSSSLCTYPQGSQLAAALAFIKAHRARIALVTIDIGANDIVSCFSQTSVNNSCLTSGLAEVSSDLPKILSALRQAVAAKTVITGMTAYDPWLVYYLTGTQGKAVAEQSLAIMGQYNKLITEALGDNGAKAADVWGTFATGDYSKTGIVANVGPQPLDVARICQWTWMCSAAPIGQNIHANATGYQQIADAFEKTIGTLSKPAG